MHELVQVSHNEDDGGLMDMDVDETVNSFCAAIPSHSHHGKIPYSEDDPFGVLAAVQTHIVTTDCPSHLQGTSVMTTAHCAHADAEMHNRMVAGAAMHCASAEVGLDFPSTEQHAHSGIMLAGVAHSAGAGVGLYFRGIDPHSHETLVNGGAALCTSPDLGMEFAEDVVNCGQRELMEEGGAGVAPFVDMMMEQDSSGPLCKNDASFKCVFVC